MSGSIAQAAPQQAAPQGKAPAEKMPPISPQVLAALAQRAQAQGQPDQALIIQAAAAQQAGKSLSAQQQQQVLQAVQRQQQQHGAPMQAVSRTAQAVQGQGRPQGAAPMPPQGAPMQRPMPPQAGGQAPPQGQIPPAILQAMMQHAGVPGAPGQGQPPPPQGMPPQGQGQPQGQPPQGMPPQGQGQPPPSPPVGSTPPGLPTFMPPRPGSPPPTISPRMAPPGSAPQMPSQGGAGMAPFARVAQQGLSMPPSQAPSNASRLTTAEQARLGRNGDSIVAHLSPGEIAVPKEMQSPQMLAMIHQHARAIGANPAAMQAGNPAVSRNPHTGHEEHSFLGTILPIVAMAAVAIAVPELAPAIAAYAPLIVGATGVATSLATGSSVEGALITGAGGAVGAYMGGAAAGASAAANSASAQAADPVAYANAAAEATASDALPLPPMAPLTGDSIASTAGSSGTAGADAATGTGTPGASAASTPTATPANTPVANVAQPPSGGSVPSTLANGVANKATTTGLSSLANLFKSTGNTQLGYNLPNTTTTNPDGTTTTTMGAPATLNPALGAAVGGGLGSVLGSALAPATSLNNSAALPANFNAPSQGHVIGMGAQQPTFVGYNPYTSVTGQGGPAGYNFFPTPAVAS